jgi:CRP/FNR family transcriptional regulator, cyclic AMP receptor protein
MPLDRKTVKINPLWGFFFDKEEQSEKKGLPEKLSKISLFAELSRRELKMLGNILHHRTYQKGEFFFKTDQPGAAMFFIQEGEVNIIGKNQMNQEVVVATLETGNFFGELALLDDSPRSASAMATRNTTTYAFFRSDLLKLLKATPSIGIKIYHSLAIIIGQRLKKTNEQLFNQ